MLNKYSAKPRETPTQKKHVATPQKLYPVEEESARYPRNRNNAKIQTNDTTDRLTKKDFWLGETNTKNFTVKNSQSKKHELRTQFVGFIKEQEEKKMKIQ